MKRNYEELYKKAGYGLVGKYSAVKICEWTKRAIKNIDFCYKQKFYGIQCHRCLQMTPDLQYCNHNCIFCWRNLQDTKRTMKSGDSPKQLLIDAILMQRKLIEGFGGNEKVSKKIYMEARNPNQVAISLAGEPTMYPYLSEFIEETKKMNMSSFLVSNGTNPKVLERITLPTQLYVTIPAPDELTYKKTCRPSIKNGWKRIEKTIKLMPSLNTRKVARLTLLKGFNFTSPEAYAKLIGENFDFIEAKSAMAVGFSRDRGIGIKDMASPEEIREFAKKIADTLSWKVIDEKENSRVALVAKKDYKWRKLEPKEPKIDF